MSDPFGKFESPIVCGKIFFFCRHCNQDCLFVSMLLPQKSLLILCSRSNDLMETFLNSRFWKQTIIVGTYLLHLLLKGYVSCSWNNFVLSRCYWTVLNIFYPLITPNDHSGTFCFYRGPFIFHRIIAMFKKRNNLTTRKKT